MPYCSELWAGLSDNTKNLWNSAAAEMNLTGWKLFLKDTVLRKQLDIEGVATPSLLHQSKVGLLNIQSPATKIKIAQVHPQQYWVSAPVRGKKGMRELVHITEDFDLPLSLSLNYKADLTSVGPNSFARFYAVVESLYQGTKPLNYCVVDLDLQSDWKSASANIEKVVGFAKSYMLFFELNDVQGDLYFDNLEVVHSGQNWCRDNFCNDIDQNFTKAFYQVPKHWIAVDVPQGSFFGSVYYN